MSLKYTYFDDGELAKFKEFQRKSYDTLEAVASELKVGMTEKQVARLLRKRFHEQGVHTYFHVPVVMFGDRTAYPGDFGQLEALATDRELEKNMPVILDAAPIYEGHIVDTSLATVFGENAVHKKIYPELKAFREQILAQVKDGQEFRDIENSCNKMIEELGAENCHRKHIGEVLGHRVFKVKDRFWNRFTIKQISVRHAIWLFWKSLAAVKGWQNDSPNWNHRRTSGHKPFPGLWAVEPHFAIGDVGVKFEEILVITDDDAYWLDDDLPHVRAWNAAA